jgi:hypothetical protein
LHFVPDQLLLELAAAAATEATDDTEDSFPNVWANAVGCASVGVLLSEAGSAPDTAFAECGPECLSASCEAALASIWQRTRAALLGPRTLSLSATGVASVDDEARPVAFSGSWRGRIEDGYAESSIAGPAHGGENIE